MFDDRAAPRGGALRRGLARVARGAGRGARAQVAGLHLGPAAPALARAAVRLVLFGLLETSEEFPEE